MYLDQRKANPKLKKVHFTAHIPHKISQYRKNNSKQIPLWRRVIVLTSNDSFQYHLSANNIIFVCSAVKRDSVKIE